MSTHRDDKDVFQCVFCGKSKRDGLKLIGGNQRKGICPVILILERGLDHVWFVVRQEWDENSNSDKQPDDDKGRHGKPIAKKSRHGDSCEAAPLFALIVDFVGFVLSHDSHTSVLFVPDILYVNPRR